MIDVDRERVTAYRVAALGLSDRPDARPADLPVLDLGLQEYTPGSTRVALAARTTAADLTDDRLITVWATRGAPHLHRRTDLPALVQQLWPVGDDDAAARVKSGQLPGAAALGVRAFTTTAEALRAVVTGPIPRGEASTEVSRRVPAEVTYDCKACAARHVGGNVWQQAGLAGGVQVLSRGRQAELGPIPGAPPIPAANAGIDRLITTYLRLLGPAGPGEVARYLGTTATVIRKVWPEDLTEVRVDGRRAWLPSDEVDRLENPPAPSGIRFLPAMDPLLQARDRDLLVPVPEHQRQVWRALGNPGVVLLDGEIAGVWRAALKKKQVDLTVTPFTRLTAARLQDEAAHVARAREVPEAIVRID
ncbi:MAG TPA: crosslink repair DNA glycosylase YcaQ family protein [Actinoplanes sp.]|nr:crosslink repair DNA glycosylase YcaQ family protein [Actinoplanes sp.]